MNTSERYRGIREPDFAQPHLPSDNAYARARVELGPWASDEQITRRAYEIDDEAKSHE